MADYQDASTLAQMATGAEPFAPGLAFRGATGMEGLPFTGQADIGGLVATLGFPMLQSYLGQVGQVPLGMGHDQNPYDRMRAIQMTMARQAARQRSAATDQRNYLETIRGMLTVAGVPFGGEQRKFADTAAGFLASAAPYAPLLGLQDVFEDLGGRRGSAANLTGTVFDVGRYRTDPVTGRLGYSQETAERVATRLYGDPDIQRMGLSGRQLGGALEQLQARGMIPSAAAFPSPIPGMDAADPRTQTVRALEQLRPDVVARAAHERGIDISGGVRGLSGENLDKLALDPDVGRKLQSFDTERTKRALQNYSGAINAIRDVFGDAGRPNAPMQEFFAALDTLTMGAAHTMTPDQVSRTVRQTHNLAQQSGIPLANVLTAQQHLAARAQAMGIDPASSVNEAREHLLAFSGALRERGSAAFPAWGAMNADQLTQLSGNLTLQARASNASNRLATAMRLRDTVGGFAQGSDAYILTEAIARGESTWQPGGLGKAVPINLSEGELIKTLAGARGTSGQTLFTEDTIRAYLGQRETNEQYADRYRTATIVREVQGPGELHPFMERQAQSVIAAQLRGRPGMSEEAATAAAAAVGQNTVQRLLKLSDEELSTDEGFNAAGAQILKEELVRTGHGATLAGMGENEEREFLRTTLGQVHGRIDATLAARFPGTGNFVNVKRITDPDVLAQTRRRAMEARFTGMFQEAFAPLRSGSVLANFVDAVQKAKPGDPSAILEIASQTLGAVDRDQVGKALIGPTQELVTMRNEMETLQNQIRNEADPDRRAERTKRLDVVRKAATLKAEDLKVLTGQYGYGDQGITAADREQSLRSMGDLGRARADLFGVRTGKTGDPTIGTTPTEEDIAGVKARYPELAEHEVLDLAATEQRARRFKLPMPTEKTSIQQRLKLEQAFQAVEAGVDPALREGRMKEFWTSKDGASYRDKVRFASEDAQDIATKLMHDPALTRRFGTSAVDMGKSILANERELNELAWTYAGGDRGKLLSGEYNEAGNRLGTTLDRRVGTIVHRQQVESEKATRQGPERHWQAPVTEARRIIGLAPGAMPTAEQRKDLDTLTKDLTVARELTDVDEKMIRGVLLDKNLKAEALAPLEKRLGELGLKPTHPELLRTLQSRERMEESNAKRAAEATQPPEELIKKIFAAYEKGIPTGKTGKTQEELAKLFETPEGRGFAERVISSRDIVKAAASKGMTTPEDLMRDYQRADLGKRPGAMEEFRKAIRMKPEDWDEFAGAAGFQSAFGLGALGRSRNLGQSLLETGREAVKPVQHVDDTKSKGPMEIIGKLTGHLTITGDQCDLVAEAGGDRDYVVHGGSGGVGGSWGKA